MAILQSRYSFTAQFIRGGAIFATRARFLEDANPEHASEEVSSEYRALVLAAIVQCSAALEAEIAEVIRYGPGHHLGSDAVDEKAQELLAPIVDVLEGLPALRQYEMVLHLLKRPPFDPGKQPYQPAALLIRVATSLFIISLSGGPRWNRRSSSPHLNSSDLQSRVSSLHTPTSFHTDA